VAALQLLGAQSRTFEAQVLGASPTVTVFQYIEPALALVSAFEVLEFRCVALSRHSSLDGYRCF
jgi:hypothetical protein